MAGPCSLVIHRTEPGYLVRVAGRGTLRESPILQRIACGAIERGAQIVLDLSECEYLDSTFLGCLVTIHQLALQNEGSFEVLADEPVRSRLLSPVRLNRVLSFIEDCPQSIGDPLTLQVADLDRADLCRHVLQSHRRLADLGGPGSAAFREIADQLAKELDELSSA